MSIARTLQDKSIELRKARDPLAVFLGSILAKAKDNAKQETQDGITPALSDEHCLRAIRSGIKGADDVLALLSTKSGDIAMSGVTLANSEKALLLSLLPHQISEDDIRAEAQLVIDAAPERSKKLMGTVMKHLNEKFGAALDRATASRVVQELLS